MDSFYYYNTSGSESRYYGPSEVPYFPSVGGTSLSDQTLCTYELCARDHGTFCVADGDTLIGLVKKTGFSYYEGLNLRTNGVAFLPTFRYTDKVHKGVSYNAFDSYIHVRSPEGSYDYMRYRYDKCGSMTFGSCTQDILLVTKKETSQKIRGIYLDYSGPNIAPFYFKNIMSDIRTANRSTYYMGICDLNDEYDILTLHLKFSMSIQGGISALFGDYMDIGIAIVFSSWSNSDYVEMIDLFSSYSGYEPSNN